MNIFFRALLVLVFIGVIIFAFARQFGGEKWRDGEEGGRSWPPSKATLWTGVKWIGVPVLIVTLFFLLGQYALEQEAYEREQTRKKKAALKEKAIDTLYEVKSGARLDFIDVEYDLNGNGEIEANESDSFTDIDERDGYWKLTPVLGVDNSYYFNSTGNGPIIETKPPEDAFKAYSGDVVKIKIKGPRRTEHCARPPLVKWGIASSSGATDEIKIFSLGTHRVEIVGQGYPVVDVFCPTELNDIVNVSVKTVEIEKI